MDSPKAKVSSEPSFPHQILAIDDRSKLIKTKETPFRQNNQSNSPSDRNPAPDQRPSQPVQSNGSHVQLLLRDQCDSPKKTGTPIPDESAGVAIQSKAKGECASTNRLDDMLDCQISIRPSTDSVIKPDQSAELHAAVSNQSTESVVCRICHLSATESNSPLDETGCDCRGSLSLCHRRCVEHWMLVKMSKQCEICQQPFKYDIVIPEYQIQNQFSPSTPVEGPGVLTACQDSRRLLFFVIYILLLFTAGTSTTLSIFSREEHMKRKPINVTVASIEIAARNERMYAYGVSLAVTIFIGFHMVAIGVLWIIAELIVIPRERLLRRHIEIFRNIYAAQLQESSYVWRNGGNAEAPGAGGLGRQTSGNRRVNPLSGQTTRTDGSGQIRRPPTPRHSEQRRVPEILMQAGHQLAMPFTRQGFSRPTPPPVMRRLAEGHRGVAAGHRHQGPRPFDGATRADFDRSVPSEYSVVTQIHPSILEIFASHRPTTGNGSALERNQRREIMPGNHRETTGRVNAIGGSQNPSKFLAEGDQVDQNKAYDIEMQDLTDEASKSEAAACSTSHIINKRQSDSSGEK